MEYYFETDDKLNRLRYAEFLKSLIENCDNYRREDSDGAYVIAIDSPWGTGKTRFAKMLRNYLEDRTKEMGEDSRPGKNAAFDAIYYNSWETDFSDDALLPLVHSILESPELELKRFDAEGKMTLKRFAKVAIDVAKIAGCTILHNVCGETVTQMAKAAETAVTATEEDPLKRYKERLHVLNNFRSDLQDVIAHTRQKKLVIIIDELDRCRPTFAIQTLELVKHLFSVPGLIFIIALDIKQLSCSVKTVYGQDLDAPGYLCRFFDYISKTPLPDQKCLIKLYLEQNRAFSSRAEYWIKKIPEFLDELADPFTLSLRDIETIIKTYHLLYDTCLYDNSHPQIHLLYIFLITLKYKHGVLYSKFLLNKKKTNNEEDFFALVKKFLPAFNFNNKGILANQLQKLNSGLRMQYCEFEVLPGSMDLEKREPITEPMKIDSLKEISNKNKRKLEISHRVKGVRTVGWTPATIYTFETGQILGDILDYNDLVKWDTIKDLTLGEYYYQQLEMFNFALPADSVEAEA